MTAMREVVDDDSGVVRAADFDELVAAARILVNVHEPDGIGIGTRWRWRIVPEFYRKKRACLVCRAPWPCWRARWAASRLSTLDGIWRELTNEEMLSDHDYAIVREQLPALHRALRKKFDEESAEMQAE